MTLAVMGLVLCGAAGEKPVIDLVADADYRVLTRLENELRAVGYHVIRRGTQEERTPGARGEVWCSLHLLVARVSLERQPREATFEDPKDDAVWAIRVTDWLRSDPSSLRAPRVDVRPARVEPVLWKGEASVRGGARWNPSVGLGGGISVGVAVWPWRAFGLEMTPCFTWLQVSRDGFVALVREVSFAVRGLTRVVLSDRWSVPLGAGVGVRQVFVQGITPASAAVVGLVFELSAVAALQWKVSESFFLEWRNEVGVSLPAIALEFGGARVGLVGAPGLQTSLGGGFSW